MNASNTNPTLKRTFFQSNLFEIEENHKKYKTEDENIYKLFTIVILNPFEESDQNTVWMHMNDFKDFFGECDTGYMKIAKHVYQVGVRNIQPGVICLSNAQKRHLKLVTAFLENHETLFLSSSNAKFEHEELQSLHLKIEFSNFLPNSSCFDYNHLKMLCKRRMIGSFVNLNQKIMLDSEKPTITTYVKTLRVTNGLFQTNFGVVTSNTEIIFDNIHTGNVSFSVLSQAENDFASSIRLTVNLNEKYKNSLRFLTTDFLDESYLVDYDAFAEIIKNRLRGKSLFAGYKSNIKVEDTSFYLNLDSSQGFNRLQAPQNCKRGMFLCDTTELQFKSHLDEVIFVKDTPRFTKDCEIKVIDVIATAKDILISKNITPWIDVEELSFALLNSGFVAVGQKIKLELSTGTFLVKVENAEKYVEDPLPIHTADDLFRSRWQLSQHTAFSYSMSANLNISFIKSKSLANISTLEFEVDRCTNIWQENKKIVSEVLELHLETAIKQAISNSPLIEGQTYEVTILNEKFTLKAKNVSFQNLDGINDFNQLGNLADNTSFRFNALSKTDVSIIGKKVPLNTEKLIENLKAKGLGGINKELTDLIEQVLIFHDSKMQSLTKKLGVDPVKGLIFYGPPGTGKTTLARFFSEAVGCDPKRTELVSSPSIHAKYVGESEEKIRKLFEPARKAQEKWGADSPLYTIIFDEFDAIAGKRNDSSRRWEISVVDQLLNMIDGLLKLNNILVIGITNHIDSLDSAVTRSERLGYHLKFDMPDEDGIFEILEIYTRKIRAENLLAKDVDLKSIAKSLAIKTKGFSGADIKSLVRIAESYLINRTYKNLMIIDNEDLVDQVTKKDFENAVKKVIALREEKTDTPPFGMYG